MSFWTSKSYVVSSVDQILDKEKFNLEELLQASEIIQETQSLNGRLIAFLNKPETVSQLLEYIVVPAPLEKDEKGVLGKPPPTSARAFRFPAMACEVFCCEARSIFETLLEHEHLMQKLFSILDLPGTLDCVMAGYFSRVVYCLYAKRVDTHYEQSVEVIDYLEAHPEIISKLIKRIASTSVAEVLLRFLGADENSATPIPPVKLLWMLESTYLEELVDQLDPAVSLDAQHNAAYILAGIARGNFSPLVMHLTQHPHIIPKIFRFAFQGVEPQTDADLVWTASGTFSKLEPLHRRRPALDVVTSLLDGSERNWLSNDDSAENQSPLASMNNSVECRQLALEEMRKHMVELRGLLNGNGLNLSEKQIPTPYGVLKPPLSITRLKAVELVSIIVLIQDPQCCEALGREGIIEQLQNLFLEYPFHNLLHRQVFGIFSLILQSESEELLQHVLKDRKLVDWLIAAPEQIPLDGSTKVVRAGYLGHVTHLANHLAGQAMKQPIAEALAACDGWEAWADDVLKRRNDTEDTMHWSCGLPAIVEPPMSSIDEGDEDGHTFTDIDDLDRHIVDWEDFERRQNTVTFTSIDLDDGLKASSSSSSSDSDNDIPLWPFPYGTVPAFGRNTGEGHSSEDEDTVVVNSAVRAQPPDAAFTDFDDVGGLHGGSTVSPGRKEGRAVSNALNMVDVSLSDDTPNSMDTSNDDSAQANGVNETWSAFSDPSDPTDSGWASFPDEVQSPEKQNLGDRDSFESFRAEQPSPKGGQFEPEEAQEFVVLGKTEDQTRSPGASGTQPVTIPASKQETNNEFNSFNFWRQPVVQFDEEF